MSESNYFREEFYSEREIFLVAFFLGDNCSGRQFSSGAIILRVIYQERKYLGETYPGDNYPGVRFTRGQLSLNRSYYSSMILIFELIIKKKEDTFEPQTA